MKNPGTPTHVGIPGFHLAEAEGFEPSVAINHTAFRVLHLRPLGHATADHRT